MTQYPVTIQDCPTSLIHDAMRDLNFENFTLPSRIQPLQHGKVICGPAFTFEGRINPSANRADIISAWMHLLDNCMPGQIWTSQPNNQEIAQMGGLSAEILMSKGVAGCIIDGALRDSVEITNLGFPCWRTQHTPKDIFCGFIPKGHNLAIKIGNVVIEPNDWLHADQDGVVRIPLSDLDNVSAKALKLMKMEKEALASIMDGKDPLTAYCDFKK